MNEWNYSVPESWSLSPSVIADCWPPQLWRIFFHKVKLVAIAFAIRVPKGSLLNAKKRFGTLLKSRVTPCEMDAWMKSRLEKDYGERKKRPSPLQEMQFLSDCKREFCRRLSRDTFFTFFSPISIFSVSINVSRIPSLS